MPTPAEFAPILEGHFNHRRGDELMKLWTDDFSFQGPGRAFVGKEGMLQQEKNLWTAFPDIQCKITNFVATDDKVVFKSNFTGTHTGPLLLGGSQQVAATGNKIEFTLYVCLTFRDGLIAAEEVCYDTADFRKQLNIG